MEEREETTLDEPVSATLKREFQVAPPPQELLPSQEKSRVLASDTEEKAAVHHSTRKRLVGIRRGWLASEASVISQRKH